MIVSMMLGHVIDISGVHHPFLDFITIFFSFRMEWLLFKNGMFYRNRPFRQQVSSGIKRLLLPFVVFSAIGELLRFPFYPFDNFHSFTHALFFFCKEAVYIFLKESCFLGNPSTWFLITLFCIRIIFSYCHHSGRLYLVGLILLIAPADYILGRHLLFGISNVSLGLGFFLLGYLMKDIKIKSDIIVWLLAATWIILSLVAPVHIDLRINDAIIGAYHIGYIRALLAIVAITVLTNRYSIVIPLFSYIGRNAMSYFCLHFILIYLVLNLFFKDQPLGIPYFLATILTLIIMLPILTYALRHSRLKILI